MIILQQARGNLSSGDQLALDLQFAADKTLTARKGPTPTFTRASSGTFVGSNGLVQTAATNVARFDHYPVTLASRGLLIEESRTNLSLQSEDFSSASWNASSQRNLTVAANNIASPSGATDADKLTVGSTTTVYQVLQNTATLTSGTAYSISCFFKAGEITRVNIYTGNPVTLPINGIFELTGSGSIIGTPLGTASIQSFGNGWYRCIVTGTAGANSSTSLRISPISGTSQNYPGNGVDSFYAWGAQVEAGSFATSYIQTFGSSVVRSADVCSISGAAFTGLWEGEATVLFSGMRYQALATTASRSWALHAGSLATEIYATKFGTQELLGFAGNNVLATGTIIPAFQQFKTAHAIKTTNYAGSQNGLATITSNNAASITPNVFNIGSNFSNGGLLNGTISAIRYYRKRLANAKLQALTA